MKVLAAAAVAVLLLALASFAVAREGDILSQSSFLLGTQDWYLSGKGYSSQNLQRDRDRLVADDDASDPGKTWYFNAPKSFLGGDKSLAYNGWLSFELGHFEYQSMMKPTISTYDVILQCKVAKQNIGLMGVFRESSSTAHVYQVRLEEQFSAPNSTATWVTISTGKQVIQREFVFCLQHLQGIQIRGSYFHGYEAVWLKDIKIIEGQIEKSGSRDFNNAIAADPSAASYTLVNGVRQYHPRSEPASGGQLQSRTCVSNDKYEILFDRPGCGINNNPLCVAADIAASRVPNIIQALDVTNGREFSINQVHIGRKGKPLTKPFREHFFFNAAPRICSTATLTVIADGDLSDPSDNIAVYGEDGAYLGTLFAGNLSYDDANPWYQQNSEATPYVDSFAISQTKMMQYAADGQIRFLFASERRDDSPNVFSGTSKINIDTADCDINGVCDLKGKVLIRSIKITFSAAACFSAKYASDKVYNFDASVLTTQPVNISLSFATPTGAAATPGGDATISVVTSASIFELNSQLEVWSMFPNNTLKSKVASLFSSEQYRRKIKDQVALGASTTLWASGQDTLPRLFADTAVIPREVLGDIVSNGAAKLTLYSTHPDNIASSIGKFSPIHFSFPLLSCFMHAIKKGPYMNVYIERDQSLHFDEPGFPLAGGDVTFFIAAHWSNHQRYTQTGNLDEMPGDRPDAFNPAGLPTDITFLEKHRKWPHGYNYIQVGCLSLHFHSSNVSSHFRSFVPVLTENGWPTCFSRTTLSTVHPATTSTLSPFLE
jgi:hypothetical protein